MCHWIADEEADVVRFCLVDSGGAEQDGRENGVPLESPFQSHKAPWQTSRGVLVVIQTEGKN